VTTRPTGREPVAVVGVGVKAPGGNTVDELWASLCSGRSTAEPYGDERLPGLDVLVCRDDGYDPSRYLGAADLRRWDRVHHLGVGAAQDAMDALTGERPEPERCAVVCGVGLGAAATYEAQHIALLERGPRAMHPMSIPVIMPSSLAAMLSLRFDLRGPSSTVSTACASGATAIGEGAELLRRGAADLVLAGGADALLAANAIAAFARLQAMSRHVDDPEHASRPFDRDRDGFVMGEGAGFVVLRRLSHALAAGEEVLGLVVGYGATSDAHHVVAPSPDGEGALRAMRLAMADARATPDEVGHVNAHGTSTPDGDLAEARALRSLFDGAVPPVTAVKGTTGHLMGGSGAVEVVVALRSLRAGLVPPVAGLRAVDPEVGLDVVANTPRPVGPGYALSSSFGFGGANASLLLAAPG
jgi:3-oxoacyl-[acyl-carrier-protein] synthase II